MSDTKKRRMTMLDGLAAAGVPAPQTSMMTTNRALRSARDAVDSHHVWDLDPDMIDDTRIGDRLDPTDVAELRDAIDANGQAVPILVRRKPGDPDRYLLVYGRRRLEAIRASDKVSKVRALVANLDDDAAVRSQISENMARRDLSYIEKAIFSQQLVENGFGNQSQVAEVLTVTKSSVSMALAIADAIGPALARAIGPAHGIGRPRWELLANRIEQTGADREKLAAIADEVHTRAQVADIRGEPAAEDDTSVRAFEAVLSAVGEAPAPRDPDTDRPRRTAPRTLVIDGQKAGTVKRTTKGLTISLEQGEFADWIEAEAADLIADLHARWTRRAED